MDSDEETSPQANGGPPSPMGAGQLSVERLMAMTPLCNGSDLVSTASRQLFLSHIKSQFNVRDTFFPLHRTDPFEERINQEWFDFERFACLYICDAICKLEDQYKFGSILRKDSIEEQLRDTYTSPDWKKLGFAMYTSLFLDLVVDRETGVPFRAYVENDRRFWAAELAEMVHDPKWIYSVVTPVVEGKSKGADYNKTINILFIKLHLLDPVNVFPTYQYLRKALPDLNLELATTNYLGQPLDWTLIKPEVQTAIEKPTYPNNSSRATLQEIEVYHGVQVVEFIMHEAKDLELWTGKYADNKRMSKIQDRCVVM